MAVSQDWSEWVRLRFDGWRKILQNTGILRNHV